MLRAVRRNIEHCSSCNQVLCRQLNKGRSHGCGSAMTRSNTIKTLDIHLILFQEINVASL